ncbi:MAG TPA: YihY/virulence factor BrkB family protein [Polyangiaceae bacterium]|nr:YihY/virulence factor BrkB family protein [Polyangiaceae bacterium]
MRLPKLIARAKAYYALTNETLDEYAKDRGELASAGLAFFTLLAIAPLMLVAVAIAGTVLGEGAARREALRLVRENMGSTSAQTLAGWVEQAASSNGVASLIGFLVALYTASRLVAQLRAALNQVWNVDRALAEGFRGAVRDYVQRRLFAFVVVLASGPLLLVVFASRTLLTSLGGVLFAGTPVAQGLAQLTQLVFSIVTVAAISALAFRVVPDTRVGWRAILPGALVTSLLFNFGNYLVGVYLARAAVAQVYGAAGSAVVVLVWLYFSAQMFLIGAEFTQVYARHFGRGITSEEQRELADAQRSSDARESS